MERSGPPGGDEDFEWTDSPARSRGEPSSGESEAPDTGERDRPGTGERRAVGRDTGSFQAIREGIAERRREREETGEFERSGRKPPPGRRSRHSDLPARVRRREAAVIGAIALVVIVGLIVLISSGGGGGGEQTIGLKRLVGQSIVARLGAKGPDPSLIQRARRGQVGGVIVFNKDAGKLKAEIATLQQATRAGNSPPLLVMVDQEGGSVKRLPQGPPTLSPAQLGKADDEDQAREQGNETGTYLRGLGINVNLAPVLDVAHRNTAPAIKSRTFGSDPSVVTGVGVAFAQGLQDGGVVATPKHFPGLGFATVSTDDRATDIAATSDQLQSDLEPFKGAIAGGAKMMMVSTAGYPTLGSEKPAALSAGIVDGLLRGQLGFGGVVITDDLESPAVTATTSPIVAAASAIKAGDDMLLYATSTGGSEDVFKALINEVKSGDLGRSLFQHAYDRITSLKDSPTG